MSEYQYYEFRAIDRCLTEGEIRGLRALSSRAEITPTSLVNTYHYGDFRGDPEKLMKKYFDAFVYVASWGTHQFMLRMPSHWLAPKKISGYCTRACFRARAAGEHVVLCFCADELQGGWEEGEGWMASLIPIRANLLAGDFRALYLGWLLGVEHGDLDDDVPEPPPPPGLRSLAGPLKGLVDFLKIDADLLDIAAQASADLDWIPPDREQLATWIAGLPEPEKNAMLVALVEQENPHIRVDLLRRFEECQVRVKPQLEPPHATLRTAGELWTAAERRRREEKERQEREKVLARESHLDALGKREPECWKQIEAFLATKRPSEYDHAVGLLKDLQELAERNRLTGEFQMRLRQLRERHSTKSGFLRRLTQAGLE